jgi:hypothetical protein
VVGDVLDLGHLVVVGEDHRVPLGSEPPDLRSPAGPGPARGGPPAGGLALDDSVLDHRLLRPAQRFSTHRLKPDVSQAIMQTCQPISPR